MRYRRDLHSSIVHSSIMNRCYMAAKKKVSRDEESYYVSVKSPLETRRHLLESTKKSLISLQNYHKLLLIRQEKMKHLENLKESIKELSYLNNRLFQKLPTYNNEIINSFKKNTHVQKNVPKKTGKSAEKHAESHEGKHEPRSEFHKLEASLAAIESKLRELE